MQRRKFIRNTAIAGAAIPGFINGFSLTAHAESSPLGQLLLPGTLNDHVLVIIQMSGGNDGLNTVVPVDQYGNYFNARPNLAIPQNKILPLTGTLATGLHAALTGLRDLYNEGSLCILQSVGYPNPNFSHFRATDIWATASDSNQYLNDGWLGRYLNGEYAGFPNGFPNQDMTDPLAIQFGSTSTLSLLGPASNMGYTISDPNAFTVNSNSTQDNVPADTPLGSKLQYVRSISGQAEIYSNVIQTAYLKPGNTTLATYPASGNTNLPAQLKIVARLINGGLKTKIYVVNIKGFDTHSNQVNGTDTVTGSHANLLAAIGDSVKAFVADLKLMNKDQRVLGMTFSEFGRRIKSNNSGGTDHGYAAPMFVFGTQATGGLIGTNPLLPVAATVNDNVDMQYDFRSVYYSIMKRWLCQDNASLQQILFKDFTELDVCNNTNCGQSGRQEIVNEQVLITAAPNPTIGVTTVSFHTDGGHTLLQLVSKEGRLLQTLLEGFYGRSQLINKSVDLSGYQPGLYYFRFQNGKNIQMKSIVRAN